AVATREPLGDDCFVRHAQPSGGAKGEPPRRYELLLRLVGDDGDLIPPATFLYVAERFGLAQELDRWAIGEAAKLLARSRDAGQELLLEINLSAPSVVDRGLPELIARELQEKGLAGSGLTLGIDEATAIENMES